MATFRKTQGSAQTRDRPQAPTSAALTPDRIAARAYEIWLAHGRPEGQSVENWYEAERELRTQTASRR